MNINRAHIPTKLVLICGIMNGLQLCGERIRTLRERIGFSQTALAESVTRIDPSATVGQSQISNIEKAISLPSAQLLRALAVVLETNTDYLLGLTDDDRPPSDLEDQVVVTVEDPRDRALVQEIADLLARAPSDERAYVASLVRRLLMPARPHIIGGEQ